MGEETSHDLMHAYLDELERHPAVVRRTHRTPDGVTFLIFFEDNPEMGGKVLYSIHDKPFRLVEAETLRLLLGEASWVAISGQATPQST
jgi:hypothetical protein